MKKLHIKKIIILLSIVSIACIGYLQLHASAHADNLSSKGLTLIPPTITLTVSPGEKSEGTMKLINESDGPLTFAADTQDFIVTDPHGLPTILPPNTYSNKYSASAWLAVAPSTFTINPHQQIVLSYYIQVPKDARPGGHYAAVLFKPSDTNGKLTQTGAAVQTDIGTLFSIHISGPITESAHVISFSVPGFSEYGPVNIQTEIQNNGDSDITPQGIITFYDMFGQKVGSTYIDEHRIFPEAIRDFTNAFGKHWTVGKFTAKLLASYGQNNNLPLTAEVSFIIFPWKVAIVILLVITIVVLGLLIWKKRKNKSPKQPIENATPNSTETSINP